MGNAPASDKRDCSAPVGKTLGLPEDACCLKCGYLLRGLSKPRCPECGRYFDRADPCTYGPLPRRVTRWQQRYAGTPSWPKVTVIFAASLYFLEGSTRPGAFRDAGSDSWQLTAALWLGVALDYAVTIAASVSSAWQMGRVSKGQRYGAALRWMLIPAALLLVFLCAASSSPADLRFAASRPALERAARDVLLGRQVPTPRRIGLYWIWRIGVLDESVGFKTGTSRGDAAGFECRWPPSSPLTQGNMQRAPPTWQRQRW
jgi:hypothetical protein